MPLFCFQEVSVQKSQLQTSVVMLLQLHVLTLDLLLIA